MRIKRLMQKHGKKVKRGIAVTMAMAMVTGGIGVCPVQKIFAEDDISQSVGYDNIFEDGFACTVDGVQYRMYNNDENCQIIDVNSYNGHGVYTFPKTVTFNGKTYQVTGIGEENSFVDIFSGETPASVIIPDGVTTIARFALSDVITVVVPDSVVNIGYDVFGEGNTVIYGIKGSAIEKYVKEKNENNPNEDLHFVEVENTENFVAPELPENIPEYASIENIKEEYTEDGITYTIYLPLLACSVTSVDANKEGECAIPNTITFKNYEYKVTEIDGGALGDCKNLTSVKIGSNIEKIEIKHYNSYGLSKLEKYKVDEGNSYYFSDENGMLYKKEPMTLVSVPLTKKTVNILEGTKIIGKEALAWCEDLTNVTMPDGLEIIEDEAFSACSNLKNINFPSSIKEIGKNAFGGCDSESLSSITLPNGVKKIGEEAFSGCRGLISVTIPSSVEEFGSALFDGCEKLTSIQLPNNVELEKGILSGLPNIEKIEFDGEHPNYFIDDNGVVYNKEKNILYYVPSAKKEVSISDKVEEIAAYAFSYSNLTNIDLPEEVKKIEDYAFENAKITSINLPDGIKSIGNEAFYHTTLTSIEMPDGIESIGRNVFWWSKLTSAKLPANMKTIPHGLFNSCEELSNVKIPDGVKKIEMSAFRGCRSMLNITIPNGVEEIEMNAFEMCESLQSITIPNSVKKLGSGVFAECTSLTNVVLSNSMEEIETYTFRDCTNLLGLVIPESIKKIDESAFEGCSSNLTIYGYEGSMAEAYASAKKMKFVTIKEGDDINAMLPTPMPATPTPEPTKEPQDQTSTTTVPGTTNVITVTQQPTKPGTTIVVSATPAKNTVLTDTKNKYKVKVTSTSSKNPTVTYTKTTNTKATSVTIPATVTINGITYKVTAVAASAFSGNKKLTKVTIGKNVKTIGKNAFKNCSKLKTITVKSSVLKSVGSSALKGTNKKLVVKVPSKKVSAYKKLFKGKGNGKVTVKK